MTQRTMEPLDQYKKIQIRTASQEQLILLLYDGAIRFLQQALVALDKRIFDETNNNIIKAQNIITELMLALKLDAGEIARNLYSIYMFMNRRLVEGNIQKSPIPLKEVLKLLNDLRDIWNEVLKRRGEPQTKEAIDDTTKNSGPPPGGFSIQG